LALLGILNSRAVEFFCDQISSMIQRDHLHVFTLHLSQIPIPTPTFAQRAAIESLVRRLLDAKGQGLQVAEWERELNALVYEVYGLTEGEIGVVEGRR
jgi:adenine-specific DNA-methyltransferase